MDAYGGAHDEALETEIAGLEQLDLGELRAIWKERFGEPPRLRSLELLRRMLAWRIQAARFGGLDRETVRALARPVKTSRPRLGPGARIAREHRGVVHEVEVLGTGFRYRGQVYASLSVIAREITGTRWNGWRFFGLTEPQS